MTTLPSPTITPQGRKSTASDSDVLGTDTAEKTVVTSNGHRLVCTRREPRYRINDEKPLKCETTLARFGLLRGTVVDISTSGLRLICEGIYESGQLFFTELATDRSYGIYKGLIRRVEPLDDGLYMLGCSLEDRIPPEILEELANEGFVNRRENDRLCLSQRVDLSWDGIDSEVEVEIKNCSIGGMRIESRVAIPKDVVLNVRLSSDQGDVVTVEAKAAWQEQHGEDFVTGVAFIQPGAFKALADLLSEAATADA